MTADRTLAYEDTTRIHGLRAALDEAGYTAERVKDLLGEEAFSVALSAVPLLTRRLPDDPVADLVRLLLLGRPVDAARPLAGVSGQDLVDLGIAELSGGALAPRVRIVPHEEILLASDPLSRGTADPVDYVAGYTGSAAVVRALTVRRPVGRALDVGTGSGVQALLAAAHAEAVVATDVNPRALELAAFNLRLNRRENVELREGNLLEPVVGERFGLIVSNAPFVISPDVRFTYRDAGRPGDSLSEELVRTAAGHLEEAGFATLQVSWFGRDGEEPATRPATWLEGTGCDVWIVTGRRHDPLRHAAVWNADETAHPEEFAATLDRWLEHARSVGADWIVEGVLVLRRRSAGPNWVRAQEASRGSSESAGEQILRIFDALDGLAMLGDRQEVLDVPLRLADALRIEQTFAVRGEDRTAVSTKVRLDEGVRFSADVNPDTAELLALLEARGTLRAALDELASRATLQPPAVERLTGQAIDIVTDMWASGYLIRRDEP